MSQTGSLDKVILEAMSCGTPVISCNDAATAILAKYRDNLIYQSRDYRELAAKIKNIMDWDEEKKRRIKNELRQIVVKHHGLNNLISRLANSFYE